VIVFDSSAIVAILLDEPDAAALSRVLLEARACLISAATLVECQVVLRSRDETLIDDLRSLLDRFAIRVEPVTEAQAWKAGEAFRRYGRGTGHPARLNFGDCFAYALASTLSAPLLFKGDDFAATDVSGAI
jgi:ribonuclease VapC